MQYCCSTRLLDTVARLSESIHPIDPYRRSTLRVDFILLIRLIDPLFNSTNRFLLPRLQHATISSPIPNRSPRITELFG